MSKPALLAVVVVLAAIMVFLRGRLAKVKQSSFSTGATRK
jgi:hypothetical protein